MARSVPRRRGRKKEEGNGVSDSSPMKMPNGSGMSKFHAPLIQWSEDESTWYEYGKDLPGRNDVLSSSSSTSLALIRRYRSIADSIYANELRLFKQAHSKNSTSDEQWVENTMRKGTLKDRIAAMSVTLSTDPLHKFYALDGLMSMVGCSAGSADGGKTNSRVAQLTAEALEDLFVNTLLPPDRKLLTLAQRPLAQFENSGDEEHTNNIGADSDKKTKKKKKKSSNGKKSLSPRILLLWRFEEMIKEKYELYLRQYMSKTLQDGAELQKIATLRSAGNLLTSMPEGEVQLLNMMVNKLGDPEKKTAAAAGHQLRLVLQEHSNMQNIVAREVQQLAHRPHLAPKALYNCIVFLNQLQLRREETTTNTDDDLDENVNKHASESYSLPASLIKTYFRLFEVAVQQNKKKSKDESGGSMKSRLLSALLTGVNRAHPYLPEKDQDMEEHVDALYRIVHTSPPAACTQALMLLFHLAVGSQVEKEQEDENDESQEEVGEKLRQKDRFYRALYATLAKGSMVASGKHLTMYFNVLYKAMKYDTNVNRVHSFAKRLLSAVMHAPAPLVAASAYLLQEISSKHEGLRQSWLDVPDPEGDSGLVLDDHKREPKAGIVNFEDLQNNGQQKKDSLGHSQGNPPCWEISLLAHHFHPSASKFVNDIGNIEYGGDPLQDFGLAPFLDKFAYRNPKSREKLMQQRQQNGNSTGNRRTGKLEARLELPMNDPSFLEKTDVDEQDEFFHRFFTERARRDELKGITRHAAKDDNSDDDSMRDEAEDQAFDAAEEAVGLGAGGKTFEEYEAMWEVDDEEEAYVDSLAMSLMEDAAGGPADIDEDPADIDDWGDLYDDEPDDKENSNGSDSESDEESDKAEKIADQSKRRRDEDSDEDAFMEDEDSDSDSKNANSSDESAVDEEEIIAGLGVDAFGGDVEDEDDDSMGAEGIFLSDDDESDVADEEISEKQSSKKRKKAGNESDQPVFADAEEYAAMIEKSFNDLKNNGQDGANELENGTDEPKAKSSSKKKESSSKKKRRRKKSF